MALVRGPVRALARGPARGKRARFSALIVRRLRVKHSRLIRKGGAARPGPQTAGELRQFCRSGKTGTGNFSDCSLQRTNSGRLSEIVRFVIGARPWHDREKTARRCRHPGGCPAERMVVRFGMDQPLLLDSGQYFAPLQVAYQTYGTLNADKSNAILICHALTGDQHVANVHPVTGKPGWWEIMIGPGKPIDTDRFSSSAPMCWAPAWAPPARPRSTRRPGKPYGLDFPVVTIGDMVKAQAMLVEHLGIQAASAWSAARWAACRCSTGRRASRPGVLGHADRHRRQAFGAEHRLRRGGPAGGDGRSGLARRRYLEEGTRPVKGLAVARMAAHITYLSEQALQRKFGRDLQDRTPAPSPSMPISRSKAICAIRARASSSASTPIPIST
jgi:homoserine O-acetyltransferase